MPELAREGFVEGKNLSIDVRSGPPTSFSQLARDLVASRPDVIVAVSTLAGRAAKEATRTIPIVLGYGDDPVEEGLIPSMTRPSANVTGQAMLSSGLNAKRLQLLHEAVPRARRVPTRLSGSVPWRLSRSLQHPHPAPPLLHLAGRSRFAHDFNNLLAVLLGNLELLRKRLPDDARTARLLDNSMQAAQRGASLTQRMLAFARRQDLKVEPVDVRHLVNGMSDLLQRSISSAAQIETRFPMRLDWVLVDANQLELALLNLVVNARDAMPDGGTITISARTGDASNVKAPSGSYVCVSVTDTGQGMDEATLARAVEPFFTTKGVGKGTGLGLSMVHGLAEQCGGRLVLTSEEGRGTTAELWLPIAEVENPCVVPDRASENSGQSAHALRIMVVDDDSLVLTNTAAMLEDLGHAVIEATSGEQALRILRRSGAVDLLITDQMMPGIRGTQLIEAIRSEWPDLKVILTTGYAELPSSSDDVPRLNKPFMQQDLARAIASIARQQDEAGRVVQSRPR